MPNQDGGLSDEEFFNKSVPASTPVSGETTRTGRVLDVSKTRPIAEAIRDGVEDAEIIRMAKESGSLSIPELNKVLSWRKKHGKYLPQIVTYGAGEEITVPVVAPAPTPVLPEKPVVPVERNFGQRLKDAFNEGQLFGTQNILAREIIDKTDSFKGEVRKKFPGQSEDWYEATTDSLWGSAVKEMRQEASEKQEADPNWKPDESFLTATLKGRWLPWALGQATPAAGSAESLAAPGQTVLSRVASQAGINSAADVGQQTYDINTGVQDEYNVLQTAISPLVGAAVQGVLEGVGRVASKTPKTTNEIDTPADITPKERYAAEFGDKPSPTAPSFKDWLKTDPAATVPEKQAAGVFGDTAKAYGESTARSTDAPVQDVVTRLTTALKTAGKASDEQKVLVSEARSARLTEMQKVRNRTSGEEGLNQELATLKGELPKADFAGVREQFTQEDIVGLFDQIKTAKGMQGFAGINARIGLRKLLDGQLPAPKELELLGQVFPPDFINAALKHRGKTAGILDTAANILNIPRALISSVDLSAPFRQGLFLVNRKEFWKAWPEMFKEFGRGLVETNTTKGIQPEPGANFKASSNALMDSIKERTTYDYMDRAGLSFSDVGGSLSAKEEAFMSSWAETMPGSNAASKTYNNTVGRLVKASDRAYSGFLNKLRADTFDTLLQQSIEAGVNFKTNPKALTDIAWFINNATGRGSIGALQRSAPILNSIFFSPRLIASRVNMLNPAIYLAPEKLGGLSPVVRKEAIKSLLSLGGLALTVTGLAAAGGADVETDPRSSDFAKIKIGNTRQDILGGFGQYLTLGARLMTNETTSLSGKTREFGKGYAAETRASLLTKFLRNKLAPVPSFAVDALDGKDAIGQPFEVSSAVAKRMIPLFLQDYNELLQEYDPVTATMFAGPALFGVGTSTFKPFSEKTKTDKEMVKPDSGLPVETGLSDDEFMKASKPVKAATAAGLDDSTFLKESTPTTVDNVVAKSTLEDLGLTITDSGIRSREAQEELYNTNTGVAIPGTSDHEFGQALDVKASKKLKPADIVSAMKEKGYNGVNIITRRHGSGPHWHISWDSFTGTK